MNNLKRVFSLALTGVMLSGMMVMGASATDFKDDEKIVNQEAVDSCVALSIINGRDDGSYDPEGLVTRAEMAKMIATAMNGGEAPNFGVKATPTYTDIKGCWAEQYIEYCNDMKIISGRGDGTFDPYGKVTGVEAAKMVLTALGFDATAFQLIGADWTVNVTYEATTTCSPSLYEELNGVQMNQPLTRDNAAQMIWNGMQNQMTTKRPDKTLATGEVTYVYSPCSGDVFLTNKYGAKILKATFDGNDKIVDDIDEGFIGITDLTEKANEFSFPYDLDVKYIGETVKVIYKEGKNSTTTGPDKNDTIYGVFPTGETETVTATKADVKDNNAAEAKIKVGGSKYALADSVDVITNYDLANAETYTKDDASGNATNNGDKTKEENSDLTDALKATSGDTVKLLLNDGKVERIYVTESKIAVVTSKSSTKIGINNGVGTLTIKDHEIEDGLAVNDVVVATQMYDTKAAKDATFVVKKAETVKGEVEGYEYDTSKSKSKSITVDGTSYKVNEDQIAGLFKDDVDGTVVEKFDNSALIGEEVELYLINGYVAAVVQTTESASNYSVVTDVKADGKAGATFDALQVQVMDSTGVKSIYTVAKKSDKTGDTPTDDDYPVGTLVTYTVNKDGEAVLKKVADAAPTEGTASETGYEKSIKSFNGTVTTKDCVLFATNGSGSWKAYKIRDLGDVAVYADSTGVKWSACTKDEKVVAVTIELGKTPKGVTSTAVYGIVTAGGGTVKVNGDPYKTFTAYSNGEKYTLNVPTDDTTLGKGKIVWFQPSADGTYDDGDIIVINKDTKTNDGNTVVAKAYIDNYDKADALLTYYTELQGYDKDGKESSDLDAIVSYKGKGPAEVKAVDDKVSIYYIDVDTPDSPESGSVSKFDTFSGDNNAILVLDGDNVIAILVEVSGEGPIISLE